jgi:hypothetical protein
MPARVIFGNKGKEERGGLGDRIESALKAEWATGAVVVVELYHPIDKVYQIRRAELYQGNLVVNVHSRVREIVQACGARAL